MDTTNDPATSNPAAPPPDPEAVAPTPLAERVRLAAAELLDGVAPCERCEFVVDAERFVCWASADGALHIENRGA